MPRIIAILLLFSSPCFAGGIHQWRDKDGTVHFGDNPPASVQAKTVTVKPNVYKSPNVEGLSRLFPPTDKVILYSASWCKYCKKARSYFRAQNIPFTEYDVETSEKGRRDYERLGGHGVPVILVGKQRLNGFSESAFERIYRGK